MASIAERVKQIVAEQLGVDEDQAQQEQRHQAPADGDVFCQPDTGLVVKHPHILVIRLPFSQSVAAGRKEIPRILEVLQPYLALPDLICRDRFDLPDVRGPDRDLAVIGSQHPDQQGVLISDLPEELIPVPRFDLV